MSVFKKYSKYYDLLYQNKNYKDESIFVDSLIKNANPNAKTILDLGCGTGNHDFFLADLGYNITGVDISCEMIELAIEKKTTPNQKKYLEFYCDDARTFKIDKKFDIVTSLFHVFGYQNTNEDLYSIFRTAWKHLNPEGFLIFDCWYGPAVLTDKPVIRIKKHEDDKFSLIRIAEPDFYPNENIVKVKYTLLIKDKKTNTVEEFVEVHSVRYLFKPELESFCQSAGFKILDSGEWLTQNKLNFNTWNSYFICKPEK